MTDTIAVAHKDYNVRGGGEILAETLADGLDCPLVVGHDDPACRPEDVSLGVDIREVAPSSRLHSVVERGGLPRAMAQLLLWRDHAHEQLDAYDTVITSGNEPRWWTPRDTQTVVAYTHTAPRYLYNHYNDTSGFVGRTVRHAQRVLYQAQVAHPDLYVCNSELVERRVQRYYGLEDSDTRVVYPPVDTKPLGPDVAATEDYYLTLGRLSSIKNVDDIIRACNLTGDRLIVAGTGPERDRLERLAGDTVEFEGWVDGDRKAELLSGARAMIHACDREDFGMATAEALASGTPVIGITGAFTEHQVRDGMTGVTFDPGRLVPTLREFDAEALTWSPEEIADWATAAFNRERFVQEMREAVADAEDRASIETELYERSQTESERLAADGGEQHG